MSNVPKPRWNGITPRATWWAVDADGAEWYYDAEPYHSRTIWTVNSPWAMCAGFVDIPIGIDWRTLKEKRPEQDR